MCSVRLLSVCRWTLRKNIAIPGQFQARHDAFTAYQEDHLRTIRGDLHTKHLQPPMNMTMTMTMTMIMMMVVVIMMKMWLARMNCLIGARLVIESGNVVFTCACTCRESIDENFYLKKKYIAKDACLKLCKQHTFLPLSTTPPHFAVLDPQIKPWMNGFNFHYLNIRNPNKVEAV